MTTDLAGVAGEVEAALAADVPVIAAAGGDGCVNAVLNALMDPVTDRPRGPIVLGAVGLGSSNDFHKPAIVRHRLAGLPLALDQTSAILMDLGRVDWVGPDGESGLHYFLLNSSLGATAKGNARYNQPSGILALLKSMNTEVAIHWATLEALVRFANVPIDLELDGELIGRFAMGNLGVIKRQHFAGGMRYDTPVQVDDGLFDINLCADMNRFEFIRAVGHIAAGRFLAAKLPKLHHWRASRVKIIPLTPTPLEWDGEIQWITEATIRVIPRTLWVCGGGLPRRISPS